MGRSFGQKGSFRAKTNKDAEGCTRRVEPYLLFAKHSLRPYVDAEGCPFYLPRDKDESAYLKPKNITEMLSEDNSELVKRPGFGISMLSASVGSGLSFLDQYVPNNTKKLGIEDFVALMAAGDGKKFKEAVSNLVVIDGKDWNEEEAKKNLKIWVKFLRTHEAEVTKVAKRVCMTAGRIYLASTALLEMAALVNNPKTWAKKMTVTGKTQKECIKWTKAPTDDRKLIDMLLAALKERAPKKKAAKAGGLLSDDDSAESESEGSSAPSSGSDSIGSSSSSIATRKAKKLKKPTKQKASKDKKKKNKSLILSDSDSEGAAAKNIDKKNKKKNGKKKQEKKTKKAADDSDSSAADGKRKRKNKKDVEDSDEEEPKRKRMTGPSGAAAEEAPSSDSDSSKPDVKDGNKNPKAARTKKEKTKKKDREEETERPEATPDDAFTAALTLWSRADMDCFCAEAASMKTKLNDSKVVNNSTLKNLCAKIPAEVLEKCELGAAVASIDQAEKGNAKEVHGQFVACALELSAKAEKFIKSQMPPSASSEAAKK